MKKIRLLFLTACFYIAGVVWMPSFAAEPTWTVAPDVAALADLQQAITNAGTIPTNIPLSADITLEGTPITIPANAIIKLTGAGAYKIDAAQLSNVIIVEAGATLYLQDITITGGYQRGTTTDISPTACGAGIYNAGELNIQTGCRITNNTSNSDWSNTGGGGVYNASGATVNMTGGEISGNNSGDGGGVFNAGVFNLSDGKIDNNYAQYTDGGVTNYSGAVFTMTGGEISSNKANTASISCYGGGVGNYFNGKFDMSGGAISGNTGKRGGGVCNQGTFNLSGSAVISGNFATSSGGGINNTSMGTNFGTLTMTGGTISGNAITATSGGIGAGVYNANGTPFSMSGGKISSNTIANNGNGSGGGVYNAGLFSLSGGEISGHTLTNGSGGGIYNSGTFTVSGDAFITNNIALNGGGIYQSANMLSIRGNSSLTYNKVTIGKGGAIYIPNIANLYVDAGVTFANNQASVAAPTVSAADLVTHSTHILTTHFTGSFTNGYNNYDISYNSGSASDFVGVTDITGIPANIPLGSYYLTATVVPANATVNKIFWTMKDAGTTGAYIDGSNILTPSVAGTVIITATIYTGADPFTDYTQDFTIVIGTVTPTVSSVTVSPATANVEPGSTAQFNATVAGTNNPEQTVTWSVSGRNSTGTFISESGLLTVAANETATTLTVTATSTVDNSKSGTATVTITPASSSVTYYNVWVNNERFASDHLTIACGDGTAVYDSATKTLTLTNAIIDTGCVIPDDVAMTYCTSAIFYSGDLNIVLAGTNIIEDTGGTGIDSYGAPDVSNLSITGPGSLDITQTSTPWDSYGIWASGDLTVNNATINLNSHNTAFSIQGGVTVADSKITIVTSDSGNGIAAMTGIVIDNSVIIGNSNKDIYGTDGGGFINSYNDLGYTLTNDGLIIMYDPAAGPFTEGTDTGITSDPDGTATWGVVGGKAGINYDNNTISGFAVIPDVTVNPAATSTYGLSIGTFTGGNVTSNKAAYEENELVTLTVTPDAGYELTGISGYKTDDPTMEVILSGTGATRTFPMPAYGVTVVAVFNEIQTQSDLAETEAAKASVEGGSYRVAETTANDRVSVKAWLVNTLNALFGQLHDVQFRAAQASMVGDVTITSITPAISGTENNPSGTDGSFTFTVALTKGSTSLTTSGVSGTIIATPFVAVKSIELQLSDNLKVNIVNTGNASTGDLTLALSGADADSFTLSANVVSSLSVDGETEITITPRPDLTPGTYIATLTVSGAELTAVSVEITYMVIPTGIDNPTHKTLVARIQNGTLYIGGLTVGNTWSVYNLAGILLYRGIATDNTEMLPATLPQGVYIVSSGKEIVKVK